MLAAAGTWREEYRDFIEGQQENGKYLVYIARLDKSGWRIVNLVPKNSFMNYVNQIQTINLFTYFLVAAALIAICMLMYNKVVRPIRRQMEFVVDIQGIPISVLKLLKIMNSGKWQKR